MPINWYINPKATYQHPEGTLTGRSNSIRLLPDPARGFRDVPDRFDEDGTLMRPARRIQKGYRTAGYIATDVPFCFTMVRTPDHTLLEADVAFTKVLPRPYCDCDHTLQKSPEQNGWTQAEYQAVLDICLQYGVSPRVIPGFTAPVCNLLQLVGLRFWPTAHPCDDWIGPMCEDHRGNLVTVGITSPYLLKVRARRGLEPPKWVQAREANRDNSL